MAPRTPRAKREKPVQEGDLRRGKDGQLVFVMLIVSSDKANTCVRSRDHGKMWIEDSYAVAELQEMEPVANLNEMFP